MRYISSKMYPEYVRIFHGNLLTNVGQMCSLRGYRQNPGNMVGHGLQCGAKWITMEGNGVRNYMYI